MSISSSIIGSMSSINTALNAMGIQDVKAGQEKEFARQKEARASEAYQDLVSQIKGRSELMRQARDRREGGQAISEAGKLGDEEIARSGRQLVQEYFPDEYRRALRGGQDSVDSLIGDYISYNSGPRGGIYGGGTFRSYHRREEMKRSGGRMQYLKKQAGYSLSDIGNKFLKGLYDLNQYEEDN